MSEFACEYVAEKVSTELVSNAVHEHLLMEFAFEAVLRSILGESSKVEEKPVEAPITV